MCKVMLEMASDMDLSQPTRGKSREDFLGLPERRRLSILQHH